MSRLSVALHIRRALRTKPAGSWMTVAELASFSSLGYPEGCDSGAVIARLCPPEGGTLPGVEVRHGPLSARIDQIRGKK